ncbi:MAG: glycoside hydrolase family 2 [Actinobacteria bacterium]|nr:glycoside hydrolase family 2 [Actinomycetota bacterium]
MKSAIKHQTSKSEFKIPLEDDWKIQSTEKVNHSGETISLPDYNTKNWFEAQLPATVMAVLVQHNVIQDPFFGTNLKNIDRQPFQNPWWYRTEFQIDQSKTAILNFDGINYKGEIWLNGEKIADAETAKGAFRRFSFDISGIIKTGKNVLAVKVYPPQPGDYSIGYVDWNPAPPDQNMGIFRPVTLKVNGGVEIRDPFVRTQIDTETPDKAVLTISAETINHTGKPISGVLRGKIENLTFDKIITLAAHEQKHIEFDKVNIENPRLWWPNNLGNAELYELELTFRRENEILDRTTTTFGIREIKDYWQGEHRGFMVNGKKVLIKGGGWVDELFLRDTPETLEAQIKYVKHLNLNSIRLEGIWGKDHTLYDLCDRHGILIMVGWSCHWEHEEYLGKPVDSRYGGIVGQEDIDLISKSWQDQVIWLRNHPSIFVWTVGSDKVPHPDLEKKYIETFRQYDPTRPYLNSTGGVGSEQNIIGEEPVRSDISGSSGVKMLGPYAYTPPVYWFTDKKLGGAYGFNTETSPGANVPPLESIRKMIPKDHLWPIDEVWQYHCGRNVFNTLDRFQKAIDKRYGRTKNVADFAKKAQVLNYELMRPMFEAFQVNKKVATGIIQWMLNSPWPEMYWQLYDSFLLPNGAFYGARKACRPLHIAFNYGDNGIYMINDKFTPITNFKAQVRVLNIHSQKLLDEIVDVDVQPESSTLVFHLPEIENISTTYFLDLRLYDANGAEIDNNFYWLSTKKDVLDYEAKVEDWSFYTPSKEYADFTELNTLPHVKLEMKHNFRNNREAIVQVRNPANSIAFFIELKFADKRTGDTVLPAFWDDNYINLLPDETKEITVRFLKDVQIDLLELKADGWNARG